MFHTHYYGNQYEWWKVDFRDIQTVTSILYSNRENTLGCCPERSYHKFTVGNDSMPYLNTVCAYTTIYSGWYSCTTQLFGSVFGICQTSSTYLHFIEVYVYSEYYVHQNKLTAVLSSTLFASSPEFAISIGS